MSGEQRQSHGFTLNASDVNGKPTIFILNVFPQSILSVQPASPSGTTIQLRQPDGTTVKIAVTQSVDDVNRLIAWCKELDARQG